MKYIELNFFFYYISHIMNLKIHPYVKKLSSNLSKKRERKKGNTKWFIIFSGKLKKYPHWEKQKVFKQLTQNFYYLKGLIGLYSDF